MKEILLTDTLLWNDNVFKAVYIPFDAYYIYYLQEKTEKYDGIYRELVRIEDNSLTYPSRNICYHVGKYYPIHFCSSPRGCHY